MVKFRNEFAKDLRMKNSSKPIFMIWLDDVRGHDSKKFKDFYNQVYNRYGTADMSIQILDAKDYAQFIDRIDYANEHNTLENTIISFDHDLGCGASGNILESGADCLKYLINFCLDNNLRLPECLIHTSNPVGKLNMESLINSYYKII